MGEEGDLGVGTSGWRSGIGVSGLDRECNHG